MVRDERDVTEALTARLGHAGFKIGRSRVAEHEVVIARRSDFKWAWIGTRLHTFVVAFAPTELTAEGAEQLSAAAHEYAITHKGGLPRGLQTGSATIPLFLFPEPGNATERWFAKEAKHRYAALQFPVLANVQTGELTYFKGRWTRGQMYEGHVMGIVNNVIAPALER